jgi:hypothetical protein
MFFSGFFSGDSAVEVSMAADRVLISLHTIHHCPAHRWTRSMIRGTPLLGQLFNYGLQTETAGNFDSILVAISIQSFLQLWRPITSFNYDD